MGILRLLERTRVQVKGCPSHTTCINYTYKFPVHTCMSADKSVYVSDEKYCKWSFDLDIEENKANGNRYINKWGVEMFCTEISTFLKTLQHFFYSQNVLLNIIVKFLFCFLWPFEFTTQISCVENINLLNAGYIENIQIQYSFVRGNNEAICWNSNAYVNCKYRPGSFAMDFDSQWKPEDIKCVFFGKKKI